MWRYHFEHAAIALLIQAAFVLIAYDYQFSSLDMGAAFAIGGFLFREHAQGEYRIGYRPDMNPLKGFTGWNVTSLLGFLTPTICVLSVSALSKLF